MHENEIIEKLKEIFETINNKKVDNLNLNTNVITDLGLDSVGLVYMAVIIEQEFNIDMGNATFNTFKTVKDVVNYIKERLN